MDYSRGSGTKRPRKRNKPVKKGQEGKAMDTKSERESPDVEDEDEEVISPSVVAHSSSYAGHQVGQGHVRTATRSVVRRGGSPYGQTGMLPFPTSPAYGEQMGAFPATNQMHETPGRSHTYPSPSGQYPDFMEGSSRGRRGPRK